MTAKRLILAAALALAVSPFAGAAPASAACPAPTSGYAGAVNGTTGLVSYWRLGEVWGTLACDAKAVSNGTYRGSFTLGEAGAITGDANPSARFYGVNGHVSAPDVAALDVGDVFTLEAWVKRARPRDGQTETVISKGDGAWRLLFDELDRLSLRRSKYGDVVAATTAVTDTNWHHVVATKNGPSTRLYVDGKDVTGSVTNQTMANNAMPLVIGQNSGSSWFDGNVDEVAVYRVALSAAQVASHYSAGRTPPPTPTPSPPAAGDPVIAAAGDIACDPADPNFNNGAGTPNGCHQRATSNLVVGTGLTGILTLGDEQYDDATLAKFQAVWANTWGRANNLGHQGIGNHEYLTAGAKGYWDYFNGVGAVDGPAGPRGKGWYSFNVGTWHIVALNSNCDKVGCGAGSEQEAWLRRDLAANPNKCTLAFMHHPRFSSGIAGNYTPVSALWNALYSGGADVVLASHDHDYERFRPQSPAGAADSARGITEFVVGTGGKSLKGFSSVRANSVVRQTGTYGVLRLTLRPSSFDFKFVPEAGTTFTDSGTTSCH